MKATHFVINADDCIAVIYQSEKFGRVVVFRTNEINLEGQIEIYNSETGEIDDKDMMELILGVLPK